MNRTYRYVGPKELLLEAKASGGGTAIRSPADVALWIRSPEAELEGDCWAATYIVTEQGLLKVASRRSEHVACASAGDVLAAGEIFFGPKATVMAVTNQSTGYCPDPDCFPAVERAIQSAGIVAPASFSPAFVFRLCIHCGERNLVKEGYFVCSICGEDLPPSWNF